MAAPDPPPSPATSIALDTLLDPESPAHEHARTALYDELRGLARSLVGPHGRGRTLTATALVHEAWMRLIRGSVPTWESERHFLHIAAQTMRRVLVDHARARAADKRGGGESAAALDEEIAFWDERQVDVLAVHEALSELQARDPEMVRLIELRFFAGLTIEQAGEVLGLSRRQVDRSWAFARAWLLRRLESEAG